MIALRPALAALACSLALVACKDAATEQQEHDAETIFAQRCVPCHGARGLGDGPLAASYAVKPRDWSKMPPQDAARVRRLVVEGGAGLGLSPIMPPNPDLDAKPAVVDKLAAKVRALGAPR